VPSAPAAGLRLLSTDGLLAVAGRRARLHLVGSAPFTGLALDGSDDSTYWPHPAEDREPVRTTAADPDPWNPATTDGNAEPSPPDPTPPI
jgi:hypothetical protein